MRSNAVRTTTRRRAALGSTLGVLLVVLAEFALLTLIYHSGDGADARHEAWVRLDGAQSEWTIGAPTIGVQVALDALDGEVGSRSSAVDASAAAWVADPTIARFMTMSTATDDLGTQLAEARHLADHRAAAIHGVLLALASFGWFIWFRRVVRRQRELQVSLTAVEVAMAGEQRLTALVRNSVDLVMVIDPDTTVSFASPSTTGVMGQSPSELVGRRIADLLAPDDIPLLTGLLASGQGEQVVMLRGKHADGRSLMLEGTLANLLSDDTVNGWVLTVRDVTERLRLQDELSHQALHDSLTGLANRQLFTERLSHALRRRRRSMSPLVVLVLDLDDFKNVNDRMGHTVGDELLKRFAALIIATIPQGDTVARLGGDEFAILMEDSDLASAKAVAERLVDALATPGAGGSDAGLSVRCSIGLAAARPGETDAEEALHNADVAMYFAKDRGKARVAVYDSELHATAMRRLELRSELNVAIQAGELVVHYQPTYRMATGELDGYEALVRWNHPAEGLLGPDHFIEIAEQSGLIVPLGRWVLNEACRAAACELTTPDAQPVMAVNVSVRQLIEDGFKDDVLNALHESGLDPSRLVLEITESTLLDNRPQVVDTLRELRDLGIHLAIDDFGTGYSSLSYLANLPVEILKIDKSFVNGIGHGGESLVEAIISLSASLGMVTLAEGVEERHQLDWLQAAGCQVGQGYYWARPLPLAGAQALLAGVRPAESVSS